VDGIYLDEVGSHVTQYCYNPSHNHEHPSVTVRGWRDLSSRVRRAIRKVKEDAVIYGEEVGCDYVMQFLDASLSYLPRGIVHYLRFLYPEMKLLYIPRREYFHPEAAHIALFNGMALYIQYPKRKLELPEDYVTIMRKHKDAFFSLNVECDIPKPSELGLGEDYHRGWRDHYRVNRFWTQHKSVYTFYNEGDEVLSGPLFVMPYEEDVEVTDALTGEAVRTKRVGDRIVIEGELKPKETRCIVVRYDAGH